VYLFGSYSLAIVLFIASWVHDAWTCLCKHRHGAEKHESF